MAFSSLLLGSLRRRRELSLNAVVELLFIHRAIAFLGDLLELSRSWLLAEHDRGRTRELLSEGAAELFDGLLEGGVVQGAKRASERNDLADK